MTGMVATGHPELTLSAAKENCTNFCWKFHNFDKELVRAQSQRASQQIHATKQPIFHPERVLGKIGHNFENFSSPCFWLEFQNKYAKPFHVFPFFSAFLVVFPSPRFFPGFFPRFFPNFCFVFFCFSVVSIFCHCAR